MRNKRFGKLLSAALAAAMALSLSSAALAAGNGETHLTIIGTSGNPRQYPGATPTRT